jgi:hypothetical protein
LFLARRWCWNKAAQLTASNLLHGYSINTTDILTYCGHSLLILNSLLFI